MERSQTLSDLNEWKPETYIVSVQCSNCGNRELKKIPKGETVTGKKCGNCGCNTLHKMI